MIPTTLDYTAAQNLEEAIHLLTAHPGARVLAGGTDLIPALTLRRLTAPVLVDVRRVPGMTDIAPRESGGLRLGALTTLVTIAEYRGLGTAYPALTEAITAIHDPQVRNQGTIGGNLAQRHLGGDLAAALLALGATINVAGPDGVRAIPMDEFIIGPGETSLGPTEIITSVDLPASDGGSAYEKFAHPASGYALCGIAAWVQLTNGGNIRLGKLALTGATATITRLPTLEAALSGQLPAAVNFSDDVLQAQLASLSFIDDYAASAAYRTHLAQVLGLRALRRAGERAQTEKKGDRRQE